MWDCVVCWGGGGGGVHGRREGYGTWGEAAMLKNLDGINYGGGLLLPFVINGGSAVYKGKYHHLHL